jgi:cysteine-rich repeat protein
VWQGVEECDDRNHHDLDGCLGDCRLPFCGDGYVRDGEECDDANTDNQDSCTDQCRAARCLDGYVQAGEECDDGNRVDYDYCTDECRIARCGDGAINADEACDPAIESQAPFCTATCAITGRCGDSDANGRVTGSDAQRILKTAVDYEAPCPRSVCEIDGNERITVTDAEMGLHIAVGLDVHARCAIDSAPKVVFFLRDPVELGALQVFIDYSASRGLFLGTNDGVACESLVDTTLRSFNNVPALGHLRMGIISLTAFSGPDLVRCPFAPVQDVPISMVVTVEDASATDLTPITPLPEIGYRIE